MVPWGKISIKRAALDLGRHQATVLYWCKVLDIIPQVIGTNRRYITLANFSRLAKHADEHPSRFQYLELSDNERAVNAYRKRNAELARRIAAASRYKQRTWGAEVSELEIQAELAQM